jgi:hypothetical protein
MNTGYGHFGRDDGKIELSHRMSVFLSGQEIPTGMYVCHKCDNRKCCNPKHLFVGSPKDNTIDMFKKGRQQRYNNHAKGDAHYMRKRKSAIASSRVVFKIMRSGQP